MTEAIMLPHESRRWGNGTGEERGGLGKVVWSRCGLWVSL